MAPKVAVIGGGIGGLAAAIALRRNGLDVQVFERTERLEEVGAGLTLWPNAVKALDCLGLAEPIRASAIPSISGGIYTWRGEPLLLASSVSLERRFGAPSLAVHRADLQEMLLDALSPERVRLGMRCVGVERHPSFVEARFADGQVVRADLLVGADGIHSVVRQALRGRQTPAYAGYTAWRSVVSFDQSRLRPGESWGYGSRFGQIPLRDGRVYWFATRSMPSGLRAPEGEKTYLRRLLERWHEPIPSLIEAADESEILRNDIFDRPVIRRWGEGRVTLLGDAAHPMTPNLGQGACQALEDAVVLGRAAAQAGATDEALRAYERERIPRTSQIVNLSRQFGWVAQWRFPLAVALRTSIVRHVLSRLQDRQLAGVIGYEIPR